MLNEAALDRRHMPTDDGGQMLFSKMAYAIAANASPRALQHGGVNSVTPLVYIGHAATNERVAMKVVMAEPHPHAASDAFYKSAAASVVFFITAAAAAALTFLPEIASVASLLTGVFLFLGASLGAAASALAVDDGPSS